MIFKTKKLQMGDKVVRIRELSIKTAIEIESGVKEDNILSVLEECTDIDDFSKLGLSAAREIYAQILNLSYESLPSGAESKKNSANI